MELKPGYKQTEVGAIPEAWEVKRLGDVGRLEMGKGLLKNDISAVGELPAIPYTSLYTDFEEVIDARDINWFVDSEHAPYVVNSPCVLLASSSNVAANTGKACALREGFPVAVGREVIALTTKQDVVFISYLLGTREYRKKTLDLAKGITIKHVYPSTFVDYTISLPPLSEQSAIATALGDVDALLAAQDALIAKKRAIKQGAMQDLLTGKRRLPGFSEGWEVKRLGDHLEFLRNGVNSRAELTTDGRVRYLHYGDIHRTNEVLLDPAGVAMPYLPAEKAARLDRLTDGDLVFADASEDLDGVGKSIEIKSVGELEVVSGMHTIALRFDKDVLADGFKAYLQVIPSFRNHLRRLASGTKVYATNMTHISSAEVSLPSLEEQVAISKVLSNMDAEISTLEATREKTARLKQGMTRQLLTGQIRLV